MSNYAKTISIFKDLEEFTVQDVQKITVKIHTGLANATPKDKGIAAFNWHVTNNVESNEEFTFEGGKGAAVASSVRKALSEVSKIKSFGIVNIQNNLPYIGRLNNGHSAQAGSFYVEKVVSGAVNG
jgi:hypothetical protein